MTPHAKDDYCDDWQRLMGVNGAVEIDNQIFVNYQVKNCTGSDSFKDDDTGEKHGAFSNVLHSNDTPDTNRGRFIHWAQFSEDLHYSPHSDNVWGLNELKEKRYIWSVKWEDLKVPATVYLNNDWWNDPYNGFCIDC